MALARAAWRGYLDAAGGHDNSDRYVYDKWWVHAIKKTLKEVPRRWDQKSSAICSHGGQRITDRANYKEQGEGIVAVQQAVTSVHSPSQSKVRQWLTITQLPFCLITALLLLWQSISSILLMNTASGIISREVRCLYRRYPLEHALCQTDAFQNPVVLGRGPGMIISKNLA